MGDGRVLLKSHQFDLNLQKPVVNCLKFECLESSLTPSSQWRNAYSIVFFVVVSFFSSNFYFTLLRFCLASPTLIPSQLYIAPLEIFDVSTVVAQSAGAEEYTDCISTKR